MCAQFFIETENRKAINIFPGNTFNPVISPSEKTEEMIWGFNLPGSTKLIYNSRAETAPSKKIFRQHFLSARCIIPCHGFYEWSREKIKYVYKSHADKIIYLAGFFGHFKDCGRFVILTAEARGKAAEIHSRIPVVIEKNCLSKWLTDNDFATGFLHGYLSPEYNIEIYRNPQ